MSERFAYLAGILDGEGYVGIQRTAPASRRVTPGHIARVSVKMNAPAGAVELLHTTFGGHCYPDRAMLCWQVSAAGAEHVLLDLLPWLIVKRASAENVLALRALQATSPQHRTKVIGTRNFPNAHGTPREVQTRVLSDEYIAAADALWIRAKELNQTRGGDANERDDDSRG